MFRNFNIYQKKVKKSKSKKKVTNDGIKEVGINFQMLKIAYA